MNVVSRVMAEQSVARTVKPRFKTKEAYSDGDRIGGVEALLSLLNWEELGPLIEGFTGFAESDWSSGDPLPYDPILLCKIVVLQSLFELSEEEIALSIRDRLSFIRVLGLEMGDSIPGSSDIGIFHELLNQGQKNGAQKLVKIVHEELGAQGVVLVAENAVSVAAVYDPVSVDVDRVTVLRPEGLSALKLARSIERNELLKETDFKRTYNSEIQSEGPLSGKEEASQIKELMNAEAQWNKSGGAASYSTFVIVLVGLLALAILCVFGYLVLRQDKPTHSLKDAQQISRAELEESKRVYKHLSLTPKELLRAFLEAESHSDRLEYVRFPEKNSQMIREFFEHSENLNDPIYDIKMVGVVNVKGSKLVDVAVTFESGRSRTASIVDSSSGRFIDFASYARLNSLPWDDLLESGGVSKESRVVISEISYYNGDFSEDKYASYALNSPDLGETTLYGYAERSSRMFRIMETLLRKASNPRVVLSLSSVGDSHTLRQFNIDRVIGAGWAVSDEDLQMSVEMLERNRDLRDKLIKEGK